MMGYLLMLVSARDILLILVNGRERWKRERTGTGPYCLLHGEKTVF